MVRRAKLRGRLELHRNRIVRNTALASFAQLFVFGAPTLADAEEATANECLSAYEEGQRSRKKGALDEAKHAFALCGGSSCPQALHADCQRWLDEVEAALSTSVFEPVNVETGEPLFGVQLSVDGGPVLALDGRALAFDPGVHTLVFELPGYQPVERRFTFTEGEKRVVRKIELQPLSAASAKPPSTAEVGSVPAPSANSGQSTTVPIWIGAAVGTLGAAGFTYYALTARAHDRDLGQCVPNCSVSQVTRVKEEYRNANIAAAVGGAGLLVAAGWWLLGSDDEPSEGAGSRGVELYLGPTTWLVGEF